MRQGAKSKTARRASSPGLAHEAPAGSATQSHEGVRSSGQAQHVPAYAAGATPAMPLTGGMVQTKLTVSSSGDPGEREADNVADTVMSGAQAPDISRLPLGQAKQASEEGVEDETDPLEKVQRQTLVAGEDERKEETAEGDVQRKCTECAAEDDQVQRDEASGDGGDGGSVPGSFGQSLGEGQPLPPTSRGFFESRFGQDFSDVRVHAGGEAERSSRSISARAYTVGRDIALGAGEFAPGTLRGDRLLAHELTHVVQQHGQVMRRVQRQSIHMESGRFVGQISGGENNNRDEVLAAMDRLAELDAYPSGTVYYSERAAVIALPASGPVSTSVIPETINAISVNETPTLAVSTGRFLGLPLSGAVGQGMTNESNDILKLQDMLHANWHITDFDYTIERAVVPTNMTTSIPDASIPKTIAGITKLRKAYVGGMHTERFRRQLALSREAEQRLGSQMKWVPSGATSGNTFQTWASAATQPATSPPWVSATRINCWEMILLAAFERSLTTWQWIHDLYTTGGTGAAWHAALPGRMTSGSQVSYHVGDPNTPRPNRGQIVFFNGAAHAALAEGYLDGDQSVIISFWPPPDPFGSAAGDKVKKTTIEKLVQAMLAEPTLSPGGVVNVTFGNSPW